MKTVVYKYQIPFSEKFSLTLPLGSTIVRVGTVDGFCYLWAAVNPEETLQEEFNFVASKTGGMIEHQHPLQYIGMYNIYIQMELMLYLFLEKNPEK